MAHDPSDQSSTQREASPTSVGVSMADVVSLPDEQRQLINWIIREKDVTLVQVMAHTSQPEEIVRPQLEVLVTQGFLQQLEVENELHYQPRLVSKPKRQLPKDIWQKLE